MGTYHRFGIALLLTSAAAILPAIPAMAIPFTQRYTTNARGEIKFVSNTIATCPTVSITSAYAKSSPNNNFAIGDRVLYQFTVKNNGTVPIDNLIVQSPIPLGMTYLANSLKIDGVLKSDTANNDQAEVVSNQINFRLGTGANSTAGGSLAVGASTIVQFTMTINSSATGQIFTPANVKYTEGSNSVTPIGNIPAGTTIEIGTLKVGGVNNNNGANCLLAREGSAFPNNDFNLVYVDVDSDSSTFNSSQSTLSLPPDGVVLYAGLYWGGSSTSTNRGSVKFAGPNGTYTNLSSDTLYSGAATAYTSSYQGFKNVTTEVQTGGAGVYTVGNIQTDSGASNLWGGWSLVVVYGSSTERPRNLTIYDGYLSVSGTGTATIDINGFITPPNGTVKAKIGAIVYDGDDGTGYTGDQASVQRTTGAPPVVVGTATFLGGGVNPTTNIFNSTISSLGVNITTKTPNYLNQLGYDADIYNANGVLVNGDTSARITLSTGGETYAPGVITSSIDLFVPVIDLGKSFVDLNGGNLEPGDILEYTIVVTNNKDADGNGDPANKNVVTDPIPANTTYVPGSLIINGVAKTDAVGDDAADFDDTSTPKKTIFRIGASATATAGGTLAVNTGTKASPSAASTSTVKFRVKVNASVPDNTDITNIAASSYTGVTLGEGKSIAAASPGVTIKTDNSSISGTLYKDTNLNSIFNNGEPLLPVGIKVTLYKDVNGNGTIDLNDLIVSEVDTDANGKYTFLDIPNGTYIIRVDTTDPQIPTGKLLITPNNLTATVAGLPVIDRHFGFTPDPAAGNPNVLLVKRITEINGATTTSSGDNLAMYKHEASNPYDDNVVTSPALTPPDTDKWPVSNGFPFMIGGTNGGNVKPNDSIEYTIYFLSAGTSDAKNVLFCDRVPANVTFSPNAFTNTIANPTGVARGIAVSSGDTLNYYTNAGDSDPARYFPPGIEPSTIYPNINCGKNATGQVLLNDNGAVVVKLGDRLKATGILADDKAAGAYGFVRFQGVVK
jgi:uncharacterized repeat protein (TIGR01451 family)